MEINRDNITNHINHTINNINSLIISNISNTNANTEVIKATTTAGYLLNTNNMRKTTRLHQLLQYHKLHLWFPNNL